MGVRGFPKVEGVNGNNNSLFPVVSGLVREFFDMLGDGEASPKIGMCDLFVFPYV